MTRGLRWMGGAVLDTLLPPRCLCCSGLVPTNGTLCATCFGQVTLIGAPLCHRCGMPFIHSGQGSRRRAVGRCIAKAACGAHRNTGRRVPPISTTPALAACCCR
ncbi:double zinc ribbon domain-containing protein [Pseudoroseomonas wenyumeiae]